MMTQRGLKFAQILRSEIRIDEHEHKFVAFSVLTKCLDLRKTENVTFQGATIV